MKKASSRGQRGSKSIKGKHVLQICVLLGVCIWLIYQIKYSHDKKKEFYEKDGKKSTVLLSENEEDGSVKLGRKGLLPGYHNQKVNEKHVEEDEDDEEVSHEGEGKESKSKEENGNHEEDEKEEEEEEEEVVEDDEEDKNKQGEEVVEEDEEENKHEEDEIDEQDQSKTGGDTDKDDELLEEEKESGSDEKEIETNHADEIDMTVDEAREEHYKADDASSAVSNESRLLNTEKLKEISNETVQDNNSNATRSEIEIQKEPDLKIEEAKTGDFVNKTTTEVKDSESSSSETKSAVTESLGDTVNGNSTEAILDASGFLQNETEIMQDRSQEDGAPPAEISNLQTVIKLEKTPNESDPNITVPANITNIDSMQDESKNSTSESSLLENISGANTTEVEENSRSEGDDESGEKESLNRISTEQTEEVDDTPETSISQEEMDILTDPQTLPDIRIEGNEEDEEEALAAERKKL